MSQPVALKTGSSASHSLETVVDTLAHHRCVGSEIGILQVFANTLAAGRRNIRLPFAQTEQRHLCFRCGNRLRIPQRCPHLARKRKLMQGVGFHDRSHRRKRDDSCIVSGSVTSVRRRFRRCGRLVWHAVDNARCRADDNGSFPATKGARASRAMTSLPSGARSTVEQTTT